MSDNRFKFRVWDNINKRYEKDLTLLDKDGDLCYQDGHKYCNGEHPEDFTIEQCTGLKDKNGKLIFEGDVVLALESWSDRKREFNVIYCDKEYGFLFVDGFKNTKALFAFLPGELEIIGNVHEMEAER